MAKQKPSPPQLTLIDLLPKSVRDAIAPAQAAAARVAKSKPKPPTRAASPPARPGGLVPTSSGKLLYGPPAPSVPAGTFVHAPAQHEATSAATAAKTAAATLSSTTRTAQEANNDLNQALAGARKLYPPTKGGKLMLPQPIYDEITRLQQRAEDASKAFTHNRNNYLWALDTLDRVGQRQGEANLASKTGGVLGAPPPLTREQTLQVASGYYGGVTPEQRAYYKLGGESLLSQAGGPAGIARDFGAVARQAAHIGQRAASTELVQSVPLAGGLLNKIPGVDPYDVKGAAKGVATGTAALGAAGGIGAYEGGKAAYGSAKQKALSMLETGAGLATSGGQGGGGGLAPAGGRISPALSAASQRQAGSIIPESAGNALAKLALVPPAIGYGLATHPVRLLDHALTDTGDMLRGTTQVAGAAAMLAAPDVSTQAKMDIWKNQLAIPALEDYRRRYGDDASFGEVFQDIQRHPVLYGADALAVVSGISKILSFAYALPRSASLAEAWRAVHTPLNPRTLTLRGAPSVVVRDAKGPRKLGIGPRPAVMETTAEGVERPFRTPAGKSREVTIQSPRSPAIRTFVSRPYDLVSGLLDKTDYGHRLPISESSRAARALERENSRMVRRLPAEARGLFRTVQSFLKDHPEYDVALATLLQKPKGFTDEEFVQAVATNLHTMIETGEFTGPAGKLTPAAQRLVNEVQKYERRYEDARTQRVAGASRRISDDQLRLSLILEQEAAHRQTLLDDRLQTRADIAAGRYPADKGDAYLREIDLELKASAARRTVAREHLDDLSVKLDPVEGEARDSYRAEIEQVPHFAEDPQRVDDAMTISDIHARRWGQAHNRDPIGWYEEATEMRYAPGGEGIPESALFQVDRPFQVFSDKATSSRLRSKLNPRYAKKEYMQNPRVRQGGQHVLGPITNEAWVKRVQHAMPTEEEQKRWAKWYEAVQPLFDQVFGKDADKVLRAFAVSQANASPTSGLQAVLKVADKLRRGEPFKEREISTVKDSILAAIKGEPVERGVAAKLSDFIDSLIGSDRRTWMGQAEKGGRPAAIDIHALRDLGFVDRRLVARLEKRGLVEGKDFVVDSRGVATGPLYERASERYGEITDHLNKIKFHGRDDWTPAETQALGWAAIQKFHGTDPEDLAYAIDRSTHTVAAPASARDIRRIARTEGGYVQSSGPGWANVVMTEAQADRVITRLADEYGEARAMWLSNKSKARTPLLRMRGRLSRQLRDEIREAGFTTAWKAGDEHVFRADKIDKKKLDATLEKHKPEVVFNGKVQENVRAAERASDVAPDLGGTGDADRGLPGGRGTGEPAAGGAAGVAAGPGPGGVTLHQRRPSDPGRAIDLLQRAAQIDPGVHEFAEAVGHLQRGVEPENIAAFIEAVLQRLDKKGFEIDPAARALADQAIAEMGGGLTSFAARLGEDVAKRARDKRERVEGLAHKYGAGDVVISKSGRRFAIVSKTEVRGEPGYRIRQIGGDNPGARYDIGESDVERQAEPSPLDRYDEGYEPPDHIYPEYAGVGDEPVPSEDIARTPEGQPELVGHEDYTNLVADLYPGHGARRPGLLNQTRQADILGATHWLETAPGKRIIYLTEHADMSTLLHELVGHGVYEMKSYYPEEFVKVEERIGRRLEEWTRDDHEQFAQWAETYFAQGYAPVPELVDVFDRLKTWMRAIYGALKAKLGRNMPVETRVLFDTFFGAYDDENVARIALNMGRHGWSDEEWSTLGQAAMGMEHWGTVANVKRDELLALKRRQQTMKARKSVLGMKTELADLERQLESLKKEEGESPYAHRLGDVEDEYARVEDAIVHNLAAQKEHARRHEQGEPADAEEINRLIDEREQLVKQLQDLSKQREIERRGLREDANKLGPFTPAQEKKYVDLATRVLNTQAEIAVRIDKRDKNLREKLDSLEKAMSRGFDNRRFQGALEALKNISTMREEILKDAFGKDFDAVFGKTFEDRRDLLADFLVARGLLKPEFERGTAYYYPHTSMNPLAMPAQVPAASLTSRVVGRSKTDLLNLYRRNQMILWQRGDWNADPIVLMEAFTRAQSYWLMSEVKQQLWDLGRVLTPTEAANLPDDVYLINLHGTPISRGVMQEVGLRSQLNGGSSTHDAQRVHDALLGTDNEKLEASLKSYWDNFAVDAKKWKKGEVSDFNPLEPGTEIRVVPKEIVHALLRPLRGGRTSAGKAWDVSTTMARFALIYGNAPAYMLSNAGGNLGLLLLQQGPFQLAKMIGRAAKLMRDPKLFMRIQAETGDLPAFAAISRGRAFDAATAARRGEEKWLSGLSVVDRYPRAIAWVYEANKLGYHSADDMMRLLDGKTPTTLRHRETVSEFSTKHMIDFNMLRPWEKQNLTRGLFIWPFVRGATAWPFWYAKNYPERAAILGSLSNAAEQRRQRMFHYGVPPQYEGLFPISVNEADTRAQVIKGDPLSPTGVAMGEIESAIEAIKFIEGDKNVEGVRGIMDMLSPVIATIVEAITQRDAFGRPVSASDIGLDIMDTLVPFERIAAQLLAVGPLGGNRTPRAFLEDRGPGDRSRRTLLRVAPQTVSIPVLAGQAQGHGDKPTDEKIREQKALSKQAYEKLGGKPGTYPGSWGRAIVMKVVYEDRIKEWEREKNKAPDFEPTKKEKAPGAKQEWDLRYHATPYEQSKVAWAVIKRYAPGMLKPGPNQIPSPDDFLTATRTRPESVTGKRLMKVWKESFFDPIASLGGTLPEISKEITSVKGMDREIKALQRAGYLDEYQQPTAKPWHQPKGEEVSVG